jgi:hypothetical protein
MKSRGIIALAALLAFVVTPAVADPVTDTFNVTFSWEGEFLEGGGSGYNDGEWYGYDGSWFAYAQWFYNAPYDPDRWKTIHVEFDAGWEGPGEGEASIEYFVNWSTPEWSALGHDYPPYSIDYEPPGGNWDYIAISPPSGWIDIPQEGSHLVFDWTIPDYNPEWVSIDIYGYNIVVTNGVIVHECVPEPSALALLALGGLAVLRRRR